MKAEHKSTEKIDEALALLNEAAHDKKDEIGSLLEDKYTDIKHVLKGVEKKVEQQATHGMAAAKDMSRRAGETLKETAEHVEHAVQHNPWKTLGWGVAGAFLVGYLLGHKD